MGRQHGWRSGAVPVVVIVVLAAVVAGVVPAVAGGAGGVDLPPPRIAGGDRVATSEALVTSWAAAGGQTSSVVITPADDTAVALASAALAGRLGGVTVLSDSPPRASTVDVVRSVGASEVVVVGGDPMLVEGWEAAGFTTTGVTAEGGAPAVAATLARHLLTDAPDATPRGALLAGTTGLPDALAIGPAAYRDGIPILLTAAAALDPHTRFVIEQMAITEVTIAGGTAVVGEVVEAELSSMGVAVRRVAGADREQTALAVAEQLAPAGSPSDLSSVLAGGALLAAGDDPADAASGAAYAVRTARPLLPPGAQVRQVLAERCGQVGFLTVLGGSAAIPAAVEDGHRSAAQRCDGLRAAMTVRVAVATPGAPGEGQQVLDMVAGPDGWASRRLRFIGVGDTPHLGIVIAEAGGCGEAAVCRTGNTLIIDGGAWAAADPVGRHRLLAVAVGSWLGLPVPDACTGQPMDPVGCPGSPPVDDGWRQVVADRFVPTARLSLAGDVHGERHIATAVAQGRNPLGPVADHLASADLAILNLETPLSTRGAPAAKTYVFRGPPAMADDLAEAGIDVVSLANNHALDYGVTALADTLEHTAAAGVAAVGAGMDAAQAYAPVVVDTPAGRVAVVGLTRVLHTRTWEATATRPGLASAYDVPAAIAAVQAARAAADHVVVAIHWGAERADCPDANQRHLAGVLRDAGADVVAGHHPHVLQGVQELGSTLVAYSLGNFVWYHNTAPSRFTGILDVELPLLHDPQWSFSPAEIGRDGSPRLAGGALGDAITDRLTSRSPGGAVGCGFP